jgi:hypothetical protein
MRSTPEESKKNDKSIGLAAVTHRQPRHAKAVGKQRSCAKTSKEVFASIVRANTGHAKMSPCQPRLRHFGGNCECRIVSSLHKEQSLTHRGHGMETRT